MANINSNQNSLNLIFNKILSDLKNSSPIWEDFLSKSNKLHTAIRNVLQCSTIFWEAFQKIADLATDAQGATKEIGASLTRLCMRQKLIESKIKNLNHHLIASLTNPVQDKIEEWKRFANQLDKDRFKETKKAKGDWKKATGESLRLQKKAQKRGSMKGLGSLQNEVEGALKKAADKYAGLQYVESVCLRRAMVHERERFCFLYTCIKPVLECQISLLSDITSLDELMKSLALTTDSPDLLPLESEEIIQHIVDPDYDVTTKNTCNLSGNTVFSSGFGSRKSSVASLNSHQSLSSGSGPSTTAIFLARRNTDSNFQYENTIRSGFRRDSISSDCYPNFQAMGNNKNFDQIDDYYRNIFRQKGEECNLRASHLSMSSSVQEPSGISGDYRVSDDDSKNVGESAGEEDSDEEDIDDEEEDDDSDEEAKTPSSPSASLWSEKLGPGSDSAAKFMASRHTISGASAFTRPALSPGVFEPLNKGGHTSDAALSKMDQSKQLYPNQAIPLPVYTNLQELTNAAQRKFSMVQPSFEKESVMLASMNINTCYDQGPSLIDHNISPSGSKTPGLRRMTLPEVVLLDRKQYNEVVYSETNNQTSSSSSDDDLTPPGTPFAKALQLSRCKVKTYPNFTVGSSTSILPRRSSDLNSFLSNIPVVKSLREYHLSLSDISREVQPQSSTLTRTSERHYKCPQVSGSHNRSNSVSDSARNSQISEYGTSTKPNNNFAEKTRESHYATSATQELLISELNQQLKRNKTVPTYQPISEQFSTWSDIDPDLPMPPPPSTVDEEIRLASIPIQAHNEVILRHQSSPNRK